MEYYKDQATRAREIATKKFLANDFSGARKFAVKAQFLYPELDGISHLVATFDIHLSAQSIIYGELDYYRILGLNPKADEDTARKRYKKLAAMLHPDKNKSVGGEEAFKFLSQAWDVISDKAKRAEYDLKRNVGFCEGGGDASSSKKPNNRSQKTRESKVKSSKRDLKRASDGSVAAAAATTSTSAHETTADGSFWTVFGICRAHCQYHRIYLNKKLLCPNPNCRKPFVAVETVDVAESFWSVGKEDLTCSGLEYRPL